ncbi:MAG: hypothetical protein QW292_13945 [Candidatus Parvarchaeota archaeon]
MIIEVTSNSVGVPGNQVVFTFRIRTNIEWLRSEKVQLNKVEK